MQTLLAAVALLFVSTTVVSGCAEIANVAPEHQPIIQRMCQLQEEVNGMMENLLQIFSQPESVEDAASMEKRKNEFIRFGKRSGLPEKRKNEFIRFGKRKNEFIRFGRSSSPVLIDDDSLMEKRKNEFIRFG